MLTSRFLMVVIVKLLTIVHPLVCCSNPQLLLTVKFKPLTIEPLCFLIIDDIYIYISTYVYTYIYIYIHTQVIISIKTPCQKHRLVPSCDVAAAEILELRVKLFQVWCLGRRVRMTRSIRSVLEETLRENMRKPWNSWFCWVLLWVGTKNNGINQQKSLL